MRCLSRFALSLAACSLALGVVPAAEAQTKKRATTAQTSKKAVRKAAPKASKAAISEKLKPLVLFNADGSPRAPTIEDAPKDDYQLVAWCHGALTGNMDLAERIAAIEPVDDNIQAIGRSYLRAYEAALTLSGKGKAPEAFAVADQARLHGFDAWKGAREAELPKAAYAYVTWQLPGECEHAATRLSGHPNLFAELATEDEAKIIAATLSSGGERSYGELPQPKLTAQVAPEDPNAAVSSNTLGRRAGQALSLPSLKAAQTPNPNQPQAAPASGSQ